MNPLNQRNTELDFGFLPIGLSARPFDDAFKPPAGVIRAGDLPSRLFIGSLEPSSFISNDRYWSARYTDADPGTQLLLRYDRAANLLETQFFWHGISGLATLGPGDDWKDLHLKMATGFPLAWQQHAGDTIEREFNARYLPERDNRQLMIGLPDGLFRSILIPVPVSALMRLVELFDAIDADPAIAVPSRMHATLSPSRVEYRPNHCPDVPDQPAALAAHSRRATGLACRALPEFERLDDSGEILRVERNLYLAQISCGFRDLLRVLAHARAAGLVGRNTPQTAPSVYPDGEEWSALVIPAGYEQLGLSLYHEDRARSRRIVYDCIPANEYRTVMLDPESYRRDHVLSLLMAVTQPDGLDISDNPRRALS